MCLLRIPILMSLNIKERWIVFSYTHPVFTQSVKMGVAFDLPFVAISSQCQVY